MRIKIKNSEEEGWLIAGLPWERWWHTRPAAKWPSRSKLRSNPGRRAALRKAACRSAASTFPRVRWIAWFAAFQTATGIADSSGESGHSRHSLAGCLRQLHRWNKRCENCWRARVSTTGSPDPNKVTLEISHVATTVQVTASVDALAASSPKYSAAARRHAADHHEVPRHGDGSTGQPPRCATRCATSPASAWPPAKAARRATT